MSPERIQAGDLVMVVRWPHEHGGVLGFTFTVAAIVPCCSCRACGEEFSPAAKRDDHSDGRGACLPVAWLKKIDPPAQPEAVEHEEAVPA